MSDDFDYNRHWVAIVDNLRAERDAARAEVVELKAFVVEMENDDEDDKVYQFVRKDADAAMRKALGPCWNHMWGPGLEELGRYVEAGMLRAETSDAECRRLRQRVGEVLAAQGCSCECGHDNEGHDNECKRCLACRIEAVLT